MLKVPANKYWAKRPAFGGEGVRGRLLSATRGVEKELPLGNSSQHGTDIEIG